MGVKEYAVAVLSFIFLIFNDVENICICLFAICIFYFGELFIL
jgi:hypothetical protein